MQYQIRCWCAGDVGSDQLEQVSGISLVTADFAMQNVALQIGLRLVAPNGLQIWRLSRYALRCGACFKVCQVGWACHAASCLRALLLAFSVSCKAVILSTCANGGCSPVHLPMQPCTV